ncbi:FAAH1 hydrolase, partial [Cercotrichas coryphoeus]|nr:FAAH1 hydrolase [Cercotrichas coryphoeus]
TPAALALLGGSVAALGVWKWLGKKMVQKKMEEARRTRDEGMKKMAKAVQQFREQVPSVQRDAILSLPLLELAGKLQEGSLSPRTVLYTYLEKVSALEVTQQTNCVRHFIPECEEQLQEIEGHKEKGLLYGIPVSIKDHIGHKGQLATCGLVQFLGTPMEEDSVLVKVLKRQGAIPFAMTNVPQSLFSYSCSNPIFGQTLNPLNAQKSPGGSSGGEGALIAGGGSILGMGSDMGGSIRLPCSFCGLCGLKPTASRLRWVLALPFQPALPCALGPMARDVDSLALCMKALLCQEMFQLDPTVPPIPFNEQVFSSSTPLRVGYYDTDGYFPLPPCMRRAVKETRSALQAAGHQLVLFSPPRVPYVMTELFMKTCFADGGRAWLDVFTGDIVDPGLKSQVNSCKIPRLVKKLLALLLKPLQFLLLLKLKDVAMISTCRSVKEMWNHHHQIQEYRAQFIAQWKELQLDVVLCPVLGPAFTSGYPGKLLTAISSTMLYNVLDFPAGVVPVSTVTEADEEELKLYKGCCDDPWDRTLKQAVSGALGMPVAVQCVALPWQEELCLRFMKEVETLSRDK